MILESDFLSDRQVEDLQMMAEIVNAMAISDGFLDLDSCLKKHPTRKATYTRYHRRLCRLCATFKDMRRNRRCMKPKKS